MPTIDPAKGAVRIEQVSYRGWKNAWRLSNGIVELMVLADVGPRIIWFSFVGKENQLYEIDEHAGVSGGDEFHLYGGHRLWVSPEVARTYYPDNVPVNVTRTKDSVVFTAPVESRPPGTSLQKAIEVFLPAAGSKARLTHRITNRDSQPTELSVWAPTLVRGGGRAIIPLPPRAAMDSDHLLPVGHFAIWSYTDFADTRWQLGTEFVQLVQQSQPTGKFREQMGGFFNPAGWGTYHLAGTLFLKRAKLITGARYPDFNSNFELFTDPNCLELETLGPLISLQPGETAEHEETWELFENVPSGNDETWIRSAILPLVKPD